MNRRGFLKGFVGAVAGAALAEELSTTRSIFLPPRGGWWSNTVGGTATPMQIYDDVARMVAQASRLPERYIRGELELASAGVPQFLTNYVDPKVIELFIKSIGETDAQFVRRLLYRSTRT